MFIIKLARIEQRDVDKGIRTFKGAVVSFEDYPPAKRRNDVAPHSL